MYIKHGVFNLKTNIVIFVKENNNYQQIFKKLIYLQQNLCFIKYNI